MVVFTLFNKIHPLKSLKISMQTILINHIKKLLGVLNPINTYKLQQTINLWYQHCNNLWLCDNLNSTKFMNKKILNGKNKLGKLDLNK